MKAVLRDVLAPHLLILFCGTAVGAASARKQAYYAGLGNAFWKALFAVGITPQLWRPERYGDCLSHNFGFTDLAKGVSGNDDILAKRHFGGKEFSAKVLKFRPRIVAFTSKRAAQEFLGKPVAYGLLPDKIGASLLFVLPSPSGSARRFWDIGAWRELARLAAKQPRI